MYLTVEMSYHQRKPTSWTHSGELSCFFTAKKEFWQARAIFLGCFPKNFYNGGGFGIAVKVAWWTSWCLWSLLDRPSTLILSSAFCSWSCWFWVSCKEINSSYFSFKALSFSCMLSDTWFWCLCGLEMMCFFVETLSDIWCGIIGQ